MGKGIFESQFKDQSPQPVAKEAPDQPSKEAEKPKAKKVDFEGVESFKQTKVQNFGESHQKTIPGLDDSETKSAIDSINSSVGGDGNNKDKEIEEMEQFPEEDIELASKIIFEGYAEKVFELEHLKLKITMATMRAEEHELVDEMVYKYVRKHEDSNLQIDLPRNKIANQTKFYTLALSYVGDNGEDFCNEAVNKLSTLKRAVTNMLRLQFNGELENFESLRKQLMDAVEKRSIMLRLKSPMFIDYIQTCKIDFDRKMYDVMSRKNIIPKS